MHRRPDSPEPGGLGPVHAAPAPDRRRRGRDEAGQALIEFVLVLPVVALLMGVAFNGWSGLQLTIRLTSAARAGAIQAASDLAAHPTQTQTAWNDATTAVNQEEGATNLYQNTNRAADGYVSMSETTSTTGGVTINEVTVTISRVSVTLVPIAKNIGVSAHATARYS